MNELDGDVREFVEEFMTMANIPESHRPYMRVIAAESHAIDQNPDIALFEKSLRGLVQGAVAGTVFAAAEDGQTVDLGKVRAAVVRATEFALETLQNHSCLQMEGDAFFHPAAKDAASNEEVC